MNEKGQNRMKYITINATPKSFESAIAKAKAIFSKKGSHEITLSLSGGAYNLTEPVDLDAAAYPGEARLRIIGGGRVKTTFSAVKFLPTEGFKPVAGKPYYVCQLEKEADGKYPNLRAVYVNGKIVDVSRTAEYRTVRPFLRGETEYRVRQGVWGSDYDHRIYVPLESVEEAGIENCRGAELHIRVEWEFKIYHIDYVDVEDTYTDENGDKYVALQLVKEECKDGNKALQVCNRVFFICNTTSVLTTPGQYAYERSVGKLYYYPEGRIEDCIFSLGTQTYLFSFKNFPSLTLRGITFTGLEDKILTKVGYYAANQAGSWGNVFPDLFPHAGAVKVDSCGEMDVDSCTFTDLPCDGISLVGLLNNVTIRNSRFTNIGATAIRVGRPVEYSETEQINNIQIVNNFLDNIGFVYESSCSILVTHVRGGRLNHNTVLRSSYSAFSLGWKWNCADWEYGEKVNLENVEVAYNYIKSFVMRMRDGGAIYTLGGNVNVGHASLINTVHDNYIIEDDLTCPENGFFSSLYHDGASSNWYTRDNVVIHNPARTGATTAAYSARIYLQTWGSPFTACTEGQSAWNILCENNYITGCKNFGEIYRSQAVDPEKASDMLDPSRRLRERDTHMLKSPKDLKKYPTAVRIMNNSGCDPKIGKKR